MNTSIQTFCCIVCLLCVVALAPHAVGGYQEPDAQKDFFEMPLEELMDVEVVSASRQAHRISESSVPVSVLTAEDIHYSGLTDIGEILQFTPGMDVLGISRFRRAIGMRGLHEFISDRTLVLINGRSAESPLFGGSEYYTLPILMEDIDRIEVVRGPGGAAWGANAFSGVVNIITKKPEEITGAFGSTTLTEFGDTYTHVRYAAKDDQWRWRVSAGYQDLKDSDKAGAGRYESMQPPTVNALMGLSTFAADDFMRNARFDSEVFHDFSDRTTLSFGAAYSHAEVGDWEFGGYYPGGNGWYETLRSFARLEHEFDNGSTGSLQWYINHANSKIPTLMKWRWMQNDIEGQWNANLGEYHRLTIGGNVRFIRLDTQSIDLQSLSYRGEPFDEQFVGAFLIDRWTVNDRWTVEGQVRGDWYSETHADWATRMTALYGLDQQKDQVLRFSLAKAFRTPFVSPREIVTHRLPVGGGLYAFNVEPAGDLKNEETYALEAGYAGRLARNLMLQVDAYYQRFTRLIGYATTYDAFGLPHHQAANIDGADSWGFEPQLVFESKKGRLSTWYAYNGFQEDRSEQAIRGFLPARHKVGLTGRLFLSDGWTLNANYRYTSTTDKLDNDTTIFPVGPSHRFDLALAKEFARGKGELMIGVSDVFNETNGPDYAASGGLSAHELPGRTFFARAQLRF